VQFNYFQNLLKGTTALIMAAFLICSSLSSPGVAFGPQTGDFSRDDANDIRVLTFNVEGAFISNVTRDSVFQEIIEALDPDVIVFQEMATSVTDTQIKTRLESYSIGGTWNIHLGAAAVGIRNVIATSLGSLSLTITDTIPATNSRGVTGALIDLPNGTYSSDLYVLGLHLKSGGNVADHADRQESADGVISWLADARTVGGNIDLASNTPIVVAGDMNLGFQGQGDLNDGGSNIFFASRTFVTGDINDEGTFGSDSAPDWDGSNFRDVAPYDHNTGDPDTQSSGFSNPGSRFDRIYYSDSVLRLENSAILNTLTMSGPAQTAAGISNAFVSENASDHLAVIADFSLNPTTTTGGQLIINEFLYDDDSTDDRTYIEFKNVGDEEINLQAPLDYHFLRFTGSGLPTTDPGTENETGDIDLQGVVPPGGLFVLYDSTGDSSAIAATITANLPNPLQTQDDSGFALNNGDNQGIMIITEEDITVNADDQVGGLMREQFDTIVEALMYSRSSATTRFARTDSDDDGGNGVLVSFSGDRSDPGDFNTDTEAYSRNQNDATVDSFAGWTIPDTPTPGAMNATVPVALSGFLVE
jgi:exonuclease III